MLDARGGFLADHLLVLFCFFNPFTHEPQGHCGVERIATDPETAILCRFTPRVLKCVRHEEFCGSLRHLYLQLGGARTGTLYVLIS